MLGMISSQTTIHWISILDDMSIGKNFVIQPNTSYNGYMDVNADEHCKEGEYPRLKYFGIGVGAEPTIDNSSYKYSATDAVAGKLVDQIPFAIKTPETDLTLAERAKYRIRKVLMIGDITYYAYYLKDVGLIESRDYYIHLKTENGKTTPSKFNTNTDEIFNPQVVNKKARLENIDNSEYVTKFSKFFFTMNKKERDDLLEAIKILKLDASHLTEVGIFSGLDREVNGVISAIDTQLAYKLETSIALNTNLLGDEKINLWIDVGNNEAKISN